MAQKKKRQHFVPQHLQRNFALDKKENRVRIYIKKEKNLLMCQLKTIFNHLILWKNKNFGKTILKDN